jgi:hypothetical protein
MNDFLQPELTRGGPARPFAHHDVSTSEIIWTYARSDSLSSNNGQTRAPQPSFGHSARPKKGMTLLPFPTGRKFSKKFFIFFPTGRNLGQISLDNSLLVIVRCSCDERGTEKSQRTRPEERCEGESTHPQPSRVQTNVPLETVTGDV